MTDIGSPALLWFAWLGLPATALLTALMVGLATRYAHRCGLIDEPGRRRSHYAPTPRGGGIGLVLALLAVLALMAAWRPALVERGLALGLFCGLSTTAAIGWYDDHYPLGIWPRLAAHGVAGALLWVALSGGPPLFSGVSFFGAYAALFGAALVLAVVASINLHNFMDGIDGLLALQALFVFAALAVCGALAGAFAWALLCAAAASAVVGFLPFNFPRARIFLGDVGSGALGFLIAALIVIGVMRGILEISGALLLGSAFVIDAGLTLASRIVRGRRWYSAHREHLYQWLVRGGRSHAQVAGLYMAWNLSVVVPAFIAVGYLSPLMGQVFCALVYAGGAIVWCRARRECLARARGVVRVVA